MSLQHRYLPHLGSSCFLASLLFLQGGRLHRLETVQFPFIWLSTSFTVCSSTHTSNILHVKVAPVSGGACRLKRNHGPHRDVLAFNPSSSTDAKEFLLKVASQLPSSISDYCEETPKSSRRIKWQGRTETMICHGFMGGGAHNGSATGRNLCTFVHSDACHGGIAENDS